MKKLNVYMAGPLFSEADQRQRVYEAKLLREADPNLEVFTPIEAPVNDKSTLPSAEGIYLADAEKLLASDVLFVDLSGYDAGTMAELGMVLGNENIQVYAYDSDLRLGTNGEYDGIRVTYGPNQFVIGALLVHYGEVYRSFADALEAYISSNK